MKFFHIAVKGLKEIFRDRKGLGLLLAFPAIFMFVFGFAFSGGQGENSPYDIGLINRDKGTKIELGSEVNDQNFGNEFVDIMNDLTFEEEEVSMFEVQQLDGLEEGNKLLEDRDISALILIPENFSDSINQMIKATVRKGVTERVGEMVIVNLNKARAKDGESSDPEDFSVGGMPEGLPEDTTLPNPKQTTAEITIKGDPGYISFGQVRGILSGVISGFKEEIINRTRERAGSYFNGNQDTFNGYIEVKTESISGTQSLSAFDYQAPGIFLFALLMSTIGVAGSLAKEVDKGTLERLKLSKMSSFDLLFGTLIPWSVLAVVQVLILFLVALFIGFSWSGGTVSLLLAILVAVIGGIASVALGLLIAAFSENEKHASNLGTLISVPMSFLVGAFFPLPKVGIGKIFGTTFEIYDILPWTHAAEALRTLLIFGGGIGEIAFDLIALVLLTILVFAIGVFFFQRNRLRAID